MATTSQRKASTTHRRRAVARGLVRVEVQAAKRILASYALWQKHFAASRAGEKCFDPPWSSALIDPEVKTAFDVFGSDLPDDAFAGIFDQPRQKGWREVEL